MEDLYEKAEPVIDAMSMAMVKLVAARVVKTDAEADAIINYAADWLTHPPEGLNRWDLPK